MSKDDPSVLTIKRGDRHPIRFTIGADITGADSVRMLAVRRVGDEPIELAAAITDATTGKIEHVLDGALDETGWWFIEVEVTTGTTVRTAPTSNYSRILVVADLDVD